MRKSPALWSCLTIVLLGCQPGGTSAGLPAGMARLEAELVDAPHPQVKEIIVTISKVTAHSSQVGWVPIFSGPAITVDLLKLKTYALPLGFVNLPPGKVTQIRLYTLTGGLQEVVLADGSHVPLKVPSGVQSGIKVKGPFTLSACNTTSVTLDFDGHKSIWVHPTGQGDQWILRPVIHAKKVQTQPTPCLPGPDAGGPGGSTPGGSTPGLDAGIPEDPPLLEGGNAPCTTSAICLSGACSSGRCELGGPGAACHLASDCSTGTCQPDGTCAPGPAGGTGATCSTNTGCLSGVCLQGKCDVGGQGAPCQANADCDQGFSCDTGACFPIIN